MPRGQASDLNLRGSMTPSAGRPADRFTVWSATGGDATRISDESASDRLPSLRRESPRRTGGGGSEGRRAAAAAATAAGREGCFSPDGRARRQARVEEVEHLWPGFAPTGQPLAICKVLIVGPLFVTAGRRRAPAGPCPQKRARAFEAAGMPRAAPLFPPRHESRRLGGSALQVRYVGIETEKPAEWVPSSRLRPPKARREESSEEWRGWAVADGACGQVRVGSGGGSRQGVAGEVPSCSGALLIFLPSNFSVEPPAARGFNTQRLEHLSHHKISALY